MEASWSEAPDTAAALPDPMSTSTVISATSCVPCSSCRRRPTTTLPLVGAVVVAGALGAAVVTFGAAVVGAAYSSGQPTLEFMGLKRQSSQTQSRGDVLPSSSYWAAPLKPRGYSGCSPYLAASTEAKSVELHAKCRYSAACRASYWRNTSRPSSVGWTLHHVHLPGSRHTCCGGCGCGRFRSRCGGHCCSGAHCLGSCHQDVAPRVCHSCHQVCQSKQELGLHRTAQTGSCLRLTA